MYTVLLAIDADEQRAERASKAVASLPCSSEKVKVVILNVFKELEVRDDSMVESGEFYDEKDLPESVIVAAEFLKNEGIQVSTRREHGDPTEMITSVADEVDADCIALSGRKRSPTGKVLFGSVTQSILLSANRPVHVVIED